MGRSRFSLYGQGGQMNNEPMVRRKLGLSENEQIPSFVGQLPFQGMVNRRSAYTKQPEIMGPAYGLTDQPETGLQKAGRLFGTIMKFI